MVQFIMANPWKYSSCPSIEETIKKMCYIYAHNIEYYSTTKDEIMLSARKWTELENIYLREISQPQLSYAFSHIWSVCVCEKERETDRQTQKKRQTSRRQEGKGIREEEGGKKNGDWDVKMI